MPSDEASSSRQSPKLSGISKFVRSYYSAPVSVCLSVCLQASLELDVRSFVHISAMAVAQSSSGGVAICYVAYFLYYE